MNKCDFTFQFVLLVVVKVTYLQPFLGAMLL